MKRWHVALAFVSLGFVWSSPSRAADLAYENTSDGSFGKLNLKTGVFSRIGNTGTALAGLGTTGGALYGISFDTGHDILYRVNPVTAALTSVGVATNFGVELFGATSHGLFGVDNSSNLYSFSSKTGKATLVGNLGIRYGSGVYANLSSGGKTLYLLNGSDVYTVNTSTGAATLLGNTPGADFGAAVYEHGKLFGGSVFPNSVYSIDPSTGKGHFLSLESGTNSPFYGLAPFFRAVGGVPEPASWAMMIVGLGFAGVMMRRRRFDTTYGCDRTAANGPVSCIPGGMPQIS